VSDLAELVQRQFPVVEQPYTWRDTILYALGCGYGRDPEDLPFVYEEGLRAAPTMPCVLASAGFWFPAAGLDGTRMLHTAQELVIHSAMPVSGIAVARTCVTAVIDRGASRGALLLVERTIVEKTTGQTIAWVRETGFARGDGGRGGTRKDSPVPHRLPAREPDLLRTLPTHPEMALIYRLSGDLNPLHVDPKAAQAVGFQRPILHGLSTFGVIGHALLHTVCGSDPARLRSIACRFTRPVLPGEAIRVDIWDDGAEASFRAWSGEKIVADQGRAEIAPVA
jgi:acyl dehydratase